MRKETSSIHKPVESAIAERTRQEMIRNLIELSRELRVVNKTSQAHEFLEEAEKLMRSSLKDYQEGQDKK